MIADISYKQFTGETHTELFVVAENLSEWILYRENINWDRSIEWSVSKLK